MSQNLLYKVKYMNDEVKDILRTFTIVGFRIMWNYRKVENGLIQEFSVKMSAESFNQDIIS